MSVLRLVGLWLLSFILISARIGLVVPPMSLEVSLMPLPVARPVIRPQNRNMNLTPPCWQLASRPVPKLETLMLLTTIPFLEPALTLFRTPSIADPLVLDDFRTTVSLLCLTLKSILPPVATATLFTRQCPKSRITLTHVTAGFPSTSLIRIFAHLDNTPTQPWTDRTPETAGTITTITVENAQTSSP